MATYRVKPGDNLWSIAQRLYGDGRAMKRLMYLNNMQGTTIRPGQTLKLFTAVKGRNDRYFISNAEANKYGLASEQQIASGQYGAGGNWKNQKLAKGDFQNVDFGDQLPIGDDILKGVSQEKISQMQADPFANRRVSSTNIGVGAPGRQPERQQSLALTQPQVRPVVGDELLAGVTLNQPQGAGTFRPNQRDYGGEGQYTDTIRVPGQIPGTVQSAGPTPNPNQGIAGQMAGYASAFTGSDRQPNTLGIPSNWQSWNPPPEPSAGQAHVEAVLNFVGHTLTPQGRPHEQALGEGYGIYFDLMAQEGTPAERIPVGVLMSGYFPYSAEQMREMGYTVSPDGYYFQRTKKMFDAPSAQAISNAGGYVNPFTGRPSGGGGFGGYGGGGGGGGGFGGGGQGNRVNDGLIRGGGSWKGVNFG